MHARVKNVNAYNAMLVERKACFHAKSGLELHVISLLNMGRENVKKKCLCCQKAPGVNGLNYKQRSMVSQLEYGAMCTYNVQYWPQLLERWITLSTG